MFTFQYLVKALFAALTAFLGSLGAALVQIGEGAQFSEVETVAWVLILGATLAAFGGVLGLQNAPATVATSTRP